jgi:hypothetical protein
VIFQLVTWASLPRLKAAARAVQEEGEHSFPARYACSCSECDSFDPVDVSKLVDEQYARAYEHQIHPLWTRQPDFLALHRATEAYGSVNRLEQWWHSMPIADPIVLVDHTMPRAECHYWEDVRQRGGSFEI